MKRKGGNRKIEEWLVLTKWQSDGDYEGLLETMKRQGFNITRYDVFAFKSIGHEHSDIPDGVKHYIISMLRHILRSLEARPPRRTRRSE